MSLESFNVNGFDRRRRPPRSARCYCVARAGRARWPTNELSTGLARFSRRSQARSVICTCNARAKGGRSRVEVMGSLPGVACGDEGGFEDIRIYRSQKLGFFIDKRSFYCVGKVTRPQKKPLRCEVSAAGVDTTDRVISVAARVYQPKF